MEVEVYSGRHPMSERTCDIGVVKVIIREENQAIFLDVERKCRQHRVANSVEVLHSVRWVCICTVHEIYFCSVHEGPGHVPQMHRSL